MNKVLKPFPTKPSFLVGLLTDFSGVKYRTAKAIWFRELREYIGPEVYARIDAQPYPPLHAIQQHFRSRD